MTFLEDLDLRKLSLPLNLAYEPVGLALGQGNPPLEVAIASSSQKPNAGSLREAWRSRNQGRAAPLLFVALYGDKAAICGPIGPEPEIYFDLVPMQVENICRTALEEPERNSAIRFLQSILPEVETAIPGLRNEGLLATHELESGVPLRNDWNEATTKGKTALKARDRALLRALGFEVNDLDGQIAVLATRSTKVAVALFLDRSEAIDVANQRFSGSSPIAYALARADQERLPYVIVASGGQLRLYPVEAGKGIGQRGRTETYVQIHLDMLPPDRAGYLWLLFSANALAPEGMFEQILEDSSNYAADLSTRLRDRIYDDVIPKLAQGIARARNLDTPTTADLAFTYQMALTTLFRLLFVAYAEDQGLLPYRTNELYRARSLKQKAHDLLKMAERHTRFSDDPALWEEVKRLFAAVDKGKEEWGIPAYNGGLFSSDSEVGNALKNLTLNDDIFGPPLDSLLCEESVDGGRGPVDFRSLSVREFGTIYEGLLQSELSVAQSDLGLDREGLYVPTTDPTRVVVHHGQVYLHNASGARKATGSYYTKAFAVEHLLDHALEPALEDHLARLDTLDDRAAGEAFFDFRVADISMGSGHFLVAAIDRIERRLSTYLANRRLPDVVDELARLRTRAESVMGMVGGKAGIEDTQLLRRQIARRCIYGVDLNKTAVDLARLSIWIHTFVPGLPLSLLDYNLQQGNSLVGIATLDEALELLDAGPLFTNFAQQLLGAASDSLSRLGRIADADASEIAAAKQAYSDARKALEPTAALFDILAASRLNPDIEKMINNGSATHWVNDISSLVNSDLHIAAKETLKTIPPFHFPVALPQVFLREHPGFDVILGNPPWDEATLEEDRFWVRYVPGLQGLPQHEQESLKEKWRVERPDLLTQYREELAGASLTRHVLTAGQYPGMGTGDPDLYKAFIWRFWNLATDTSGRIGVVLPRSVFVAKGSGEFRKAVFTKGTITDLTMMVNNRKWIFDDVHPQYTIGLTTIQKISPTENSTLPLHGPYRSLEQFKVGVDKPPVSFAIQDVIEWTDTSALPLLPTEQSGQVFVQIRKAPRLDFNDSKTWHARPYAELHATNDRKNGLIELSKDRPNGYWPVFKGESFDIWESDTEGYYGWGNPDKVKAALQARRLSGYGRSTSPFTEFTKVEITDSRTLSCLHPRIAFRDIARATDSRTVRAALIPPNVFITNKGPYFLWPRGDEKDQAYLLGILCSIPLDWYSRRFVEVSMNYHILNGFPIPRPSRDNALWQRTIELAGRLACPDERFAEWAEAVGVKYGPLEAVEKDDMIAELDAVVAHLYGLSETQLHHIFETFHEGWDYEERLRATLKHYTNHKANRSMQ